MIDEKQIRNEIRESLKYRYSNIINVVSIVQEIRKTLPDENNLVVQQEYHQATYDVIQNDMKLTGVYQFGKKINNKLMKLPYYNKLIHPLVNYIKNNLAEKFKYKPTITYADLMGGDIKEFLDKAYLTLLNRIPDENGESIYRNFLLNNRNDRVLVLGAIRYSKEGRMHNVAVKGLQIRYLLRKMYKVLSAIPFMGYIINLVRDTLTMSKKFDNLFYLESIQAEKLVNVVHEKELLENKVKQLEAKLGQYSVANDELKRQINKCMDSLLRVDRETQITRKTIDVSLETIKLQNERIAAIENRIMIYAEKQQNSKLCQDKLRKINDDIYLAFEDKFRGSQEIIKERLKKYVAIIEEIDQKNNHDHTNVLDIGCGRGEWLELLKENRFVYLGIDVNQTMINVCKEKNLNVQCTDALSYLKVQKGESYYAITGFQIAEHLKPEELTEMVQEAYRILKPGGVAIFETPNPENLIVGACNFYYDSTHNRPIPPERLRFLAEYVGFAKVELLRSNPYNAIDEQKLDNANEEMMKIVQFFNNMCDYAIVAYKE